MPNRTNNDKHLSSTAKQHATKGSLSLSLFSLLSLHPFISLCLCSAGQTCDQLHNFAYVFVSESKGTNGDVPYLCNDHPHHLEKKDVQCSLPINEAIQWCNEDQLCHGYLINTDEKWQKKISQNGMPVVQLFGEGLTATSDPIWRTFKKQH